MLITLCLILSISPFSRLYAGGRYNLFDNCGTLNRGHLAGKELEKYLKRNIYIERDRGTCGPSIDKSDVRGGHWRLVTNRWLKNKNWRKTMQHGPCPLHNDGDGVEEGWYNTIRIQTNELYLYRNIFWKEYILCISLENKRERRFRSPWSLSRALPQGHDIIARHTLHTDSHQQANTHTHTHTHFFFHRVPTVS